MKTKLLSKTSSFGGKTIKLFSIDGVIWSSRQWELEKIQERHEAERVKLDPNAVSEEESENKEAVAENAPDQLEEIVKDIALEDAATKSGKKGAKPKLPSKPAIVKNKPNKELKVAPKIRKSTAKNKIQSKRKKAA